MGSQGRSADNKAEESLAEKMVLQNKVVRTEWMGFYYRHTQSRSQLS